MTNNRVNATNTNAASYQGTVTMNAISRTTTLENLAVSVKIKLAGLWAAMMFLYIYADFLSLFKPGVLGEMSDGFMGPLTVSQGTLLMAAVLMMIPSVMIFLPLIMKPRVSRWVNIVFGALYTLVNIANLIGESWAYYLGFGIVEIVLTILIVWYAWTWPTTDGAVA